MTAIDIGGIIVAIVAAIGAWASQRAASKASTINATVTSRLDAEKEAYERARKFDVETIERQNAKIHELESENRKLHEEVRTLTVRLRRLEEGFPNILEGILRERLEEPPDQE